MAFNFPNTPTVGYQWWWGEGLPTYIYQGNGIWNKRAGTALRANKFVNPAWQINDQNGLTDGSNVAGLVMAEQWYVYYAFSNGVYRGQRLALATPGGGKHRLRISMTTAETALAAGEWLVLGTTIEGNRMADLNYGTANAKWSVIRFGCKAPTGTYCVAIRNNGLTRSFIYPFTVTPANHNKDHVQIMTLPPCYDGAWLTDNQAWGYIQWIILNANFTSNEWEWLNGNFAGGSSLTNAFQQTVGNTFELFDVGFYADPHITAQPPEFQVPNIEDDHQDCLRYWYKCTSGRGIVSGTTVAYLMMPHYVPMRAVPSLSVVGSSLRVYDGNAPNIASININASTQTFFYAVVNTTGLTNGRAVNILADAQNTNYIAVNARL